MFLPSCEVLLLCVCLCRNPVDKKSNSALKQQRRDNAARQHRGEGMGGRDQANPKRERFKDTKGINKEKVELSVGTLGDEFM